ncbi:hypothetical protein RHGRI_035309 [Rhododendron griersonianum]|uniref:Isochorismatase-like domain-containing protein n=1 Tax=Rhododendron griersonianum TaxID=479676 RepID=A0AAV6I7X5_9ERIC|nr:hypothetical protein RHGRI_035309 [Rhododendron griersonianum]
MEVSADLAKMEEQQQSPRRRQKGGLMTMPFIIANEGLEKLASYGLLSNMILYLMEEYHIGVIEGTNILFFWSAATNFFPLFGAFISDSYLGRFLTIGLGSIFSLLGMVLLWMTTVIPQARPPYCNQLKGESCKSPTGSQYVTLLFSFVLMSIGAGGIRPCSLAFGANQVDQRDNPNNKQVLEKFFSWYYAAISISVIIALTVIVYIQDNAGWKVGFGVPAILMFLSALAFFIASPFYIKQKATMSLFTNFARVIVVCIKNIKVAFPSDESNLRYHRMSDSTLSKPTRKLRFLNKACIIRNPEGITPEGEASNAWSLCTVDQVEELKSLIRVMPLWSSSIMMSVNISQATFQFLQAQSMNRHLTPRFQIPAGSFSVFILIGIVMWIFLYDRIIIPVASKIRGKPFSVGVKVRMGVGLFCSFLAMVVAATVEHYRKRKALESGYYNNPIGVVHMSAMLLVPQYLLMGVAEALNVIASNEFFYSELPKSMSSMALALSGLGLGVGSLLASLILSTVEKVTKRGGKGSWISNNINQSHYESYYWLLSIMSLVNVLYFILCSWAYGPCADQGFSKVLFDREGFFKLNDKGEDLKEELHLKGSGVKNGEEKSKEDENDFILPDGLMRVDGGQAIVPNVIKAVEVARRRGILVIWVVREHDPLGRDVELFRQHLYSSEKAGPTSKGSLGAELVDGLVIKEGDYKVVKTRFSAFFATHLNSFLKTAGINSLVVVGVQTPNCIRQTVFDAVALDYKYVAVIVDGTAAATPDIHFGRLS